MRLAPYGTVAAFLCLTLAAAAESLVPPVPADQFGGERRQPAVIILRRAVLDNHVAALNVTGLRQAPSKRWKKLSRRFRRLAV